MQYTLSPLGDQAVVIEVGKKIDAIIRAESERQLFLDWKQNLRIG